jgi:hypothetical protein
LIGQVESCGTIERVAATDITEHSFQVGASATTWNDIATSPGGVEVMGFPEEIRRARVPDRTIGFATVWGRRRTALMLELQGSPYVEFPVPNVLIPMPGASTPEFFAGAAHVSDDVREGAHLRS